MDHDLCIHSPAVGHGLFPAIGYCAVHICVQAFEDLFFRSSGWIHSSGICWVTGDPVFNLLRKRPGLLSSEATPSNVPTSNRDEGSNFSTSSPTPGCYVSAVIQTINDLVVQLSGAPCPQPAGRCLENPGKPEARAAVGRASSPTAWVCGVRACQAPSWAPPVMPLLTSTASRATGSGTTVPGPWLRPWPPTGPSPCCSEWACWLAENSFLSSLLLPQGPLCFLHRGVDGTKPRGFLSHLHGPWKT